MNKNLVFIIILLILVGAFFSWSYFRDRQLAQNPACTQEAMICPDGTPVGRQGPSCEFSACPETPQQNITLNLPAENAEVGLPLVIEGTARVFESALNYRLKDANGKVLINGFTMADAPDVGTYGPFSIRVNYPESTTASGMVEVFSYSAEDGSEINLLQRSIRFSATESQTVSVYFGNRLKDPEVLDCSNVFPVSRRIAKTSAVARAALEELLFGTTLDDIDQGYFTNINGGVTINSLTINETGIARVDFDDILQAGVAGSCRVQFIRSQIEKTLLQFPTVKEVIISIDGSSQDILQP